MPVPRALDLAELNAQLLASCRRDESRSLAGRSQSVGALLLMEKEHLLLLAGEDFQLAEVSFPRVNQAGYAKLLANAYSVPLKPGSMVEARAYSSLVEFRCDGERIAQHQRSYGRAQQVLDLEHYLEGTERNAGAPAELPYMPERLVTGPNCLLK